MSVDRISAGSAEVFPAVAARVLFPGIRAGDRMRAGVNGWLWMARLIVGADVAAGYFDDENSGARSLSAAHEPGACDAEPVPGALDLLSVLAETVCCG